jgi:endonuclease-3 related protein
MERYFRASGYFRQKTARVRNFLNHLERAAKGRLDLFFEGSTPRLREKLLSLKGVGPETADSMLLYAAGRPVFVVDAYTRRIGKRWGVLQGKESYDAVQAIFTNALPRSVKLFNEYHALLVKLGKDICKKREPLCRACPLSRLCETGQRRMK